MNRITHNPRLHTVGLAFAVAACILLLSSVVTSAIDLLFRTTSVTLPHWESVLLSIGVQQGLIFIGGSLLFLRWRGYTLDWVGVHRPDRRGLFWIAGGWFVTITGVFVLLLVVVLGVGVRPAQNQIGGVLATDPALVGLLIPLMVLVVGPGEEFVFRGIVQGTLRERFSAPGAIALSSVIFASIHFGSLSGDPVQRLLSVSLLVFPAIVFGTAYEYTDNIVVPSIIHGLYNATLLWLNYLATELAPASVLIAVTGF